VLEDVDAASNVVKRRDGRRTAEVMQIENVDLPPSKSIWRMLLESRDDDCRELVHLLIEKSVRLKEEATKPEVIRSLAAGIATMPGLSLVGSADSTLAKIGAEALETATATIEGMETIDRFLSMHIKPLKALLENGAEVDESLVNELLGIPGSSCRSLPTREVSYEFTAGSQTIPDEFQRGGVEHSTEVGVNVLGPLNANTTDTGNGTTKKFVFDFKDKLNLTGLLNVLDGVVDTPCRMLIMSELEFAAFCKLLQLSPMPL
jgi:hypothetical protein